MQANSQKQYLVYQNNTKQLQFWAEIPPEYRPIKLVQNINLWIKSILKETDHEVQIALRMAKYLMEAELMQDIKTTVDYLCQHFVNASYICIGASPKPIKWALKNIYGKNVINLNASGVKPTITPPNEFKSYLMNKLTSLSQARQLILIDYGSDGDTLLTIREFIKNCGWQFPEIVCVAIGADGRENKLMQKNIKTISQTPVLSEYLEKQLGKNDIFGRSRAKKNNFGNWSFAYKDEPQDQNYQLNKEAFIKVYNLTPFSSKQVSLLSLTAIADASGVNMDELVEDFETNENNDAANYDLFEI